MGLGNDVGKVCIINVWSPMFKICRNMEKYKPFSDYAHINKQLIYWGLQVRWCSSRRFFLYLWSFDLRLNLYRPHSWKSWQLSYIKNCEFKIISSRLMKAKNAFYLLGSILKSGCFFCCHLGTLSHDCIWTFAHFEKPAKVLSQYINRFEWLQTSYHL